MLLMDLNPTPKTMVPWCVKIIKNVTKESKVNELVSYI